CARSLLGRAMDYW
nr:immunoglobulin heavy chain junction region [Mus musculus]MBK4185593.1 immunoglobulin heavy chain junction region [Mus musculus]